MRKKDAQPLVDLPFRDRKKVESHPERTWLSRWSRRPPNLGPMPRETDVGQSVGRSVGPPSIIASTMNVYGFCIHLPGDNETNATHQRLCASQLDKKLWPTEDDLEGARLGSYLETYPRTPEK